MSIFVKFLVYSLHTLNGKKNSAKALLHQLNTSEMDKFKRQTGQVWISSAHQEKITAINEQKIFHQVGIKYQVMKVRAKISYMALLRCMTIQEVFLHAIYSAYIQNLDHYGFKDQ